MFPLPIQVARMCNYGAGERDRMERGTQTHPLAMPGARLHRKREVSDVRRMEYPPCHVPFSGGGGTGEPTSVKADVQESDTMRMTRMRMLVMTAALAGLAVSPAALAQGDGAEAAVDGAEMVSAPEEPMAPADEAAGGDGGEPEADAANYDRQLLTIEEEVHSLKEQVFRAKHARAQGDRGPGHRCGLPRNGLA